MHQWKSLKVVLLGLLVISDGAEADRGMDNCTNPHPTNSCIHMEVKRGWREIHRAPTGAESAELCTTGLPHWGFVSGHVVGNLWLVSNLNKIWFSTEILMTWFQWYDDHKSNHHLDYLEKKNNQFCLFVWLIKIWNVMFSFAWAHVGVFMQSHILDSPLFGIDSTVRFLWYVHLWLMVYLHSLHSGRLICMCTQEGDIL